MPILLTTPVKNPSTGEDMPFAGVRQVRLDPLADVPVASYEMAFGKIVDNKFVSMHIVGKYVFRDQPAESAWGVVDGVEGMHESVPANPAFTELVSGGVHVIKDGEIGQVITAYDLISKAIYTHEQAKRPELFAGTIV